MKQDKQPSFGLLGWPPHPNMKWYTGMGAMAAFWFGQLEMGLAFAVGCALLFMYEREHPFEKHGYSDTPVGPTPPRPRDSNH